MIDFHTHLDLYPEPHRVADEAQKRSIGLLSVTTTPSAWRGTAALGDGLSVVKTALGLHPQLARQRKSELAMFDERLPETNFVGEVGLDGGAENKPFWDDQLQVFQHILQACTAAGGKLISIHSRRAVDPTLRMLGAHPGSGTPLLHWFSGTRTQLDRASAVGCWFSVNPAMLLGEKGQALLAAMPRDRVVLESDGPFATVNKKPLFPWDIQSAVPAIARLWSLEEAAASAQIRSNESRLIQSVSSDAKRISE
ncbi:TatD family hydrolase [Microbacterium sp. ISL-59]|uniref:Qat anti-phage system TatD family nuclease QatD n=1 Tax=Microbacterium sp. ISL-59 TaxID=2819159 RepID=UPI001BE5DAC2|nr:Qat anti-phage system TatD family nuclease QatD [Microbacterium sp. ISL-59]MBT2495609.1 TatD family hydrolase [Microbacterium sp. ISL-59]